MYYRCVLALAAILLLTPPAFAAGKNALVGTWSLVSATGVPQGEPYGPHPLGQVIFTPDGHFSQILLSSELPKFRGGNRTTGTPDENAAVVKGSIANIGTYRLTGNTLHLHIVGSTFPNYSRTDQTRPVHLMGERFSWKNLTASGGGVTTLVWQRAK